MLYDSCDLVGEIRRVVLKIEGTRRDSLVEAVRRAVTQFLDLKNIKIANQPSGTQELRVLIQEEFCKDDPAKCCAYAVRLQLVVNVTPGCSFGSIPNTARPGIVWEDGFLIVVPPGTAEQPIIDELRNLMTGLLQYRP